MLETLSRRMMGRYIPGPFDDAEGSDLRTRCRLIASGVRHFPDKQDFEHIEEEGCHEMQSYLHRPTGLLYRHTFHTVIPFELEFPMVLRDWQQRASRLSAAAKRKRLIACFYDMRSGYAQHPAHAPMLPPEELVECAELLNTASGTYIDLLYITESESSPGIVERLHENVLHISISPGDTAFVYRYIAAHLSFSITAICRKVWRRCQKWLWRVESSNQDTTLTLKVMGKKVASFTEPLAQEYYKKKYILLHKKDIRILALGSSHANRGLNPMLMPEPTVNLGTTSQDLYQSYHLLRYALRKRPGIQKVLLFYAPFSPGYNISHSSEKFRAAYVHRLFDIAPFQADPVIEPHDRFPYWARARVQTVYADHNPLFAVKKQPTAEIQQRATKHMEFGSSRSMLSYLESISEYLLQTNRSLYIIIPPFSKDYKEALSDSTWLRAQDALCHSSVSVISYLDDPDFLPHDFSDSDHLNAYGAIKLTRKIARDIGRSNVSEQ